MYLVSMFFLFHVHLNMVGCKRGLNLVNMSLQHHRLRSNSLFLVILAEPKVIDFGEICAKSLASKKMKIANSLSSHIYIKAEVNIWFLCFSFTLCLRYIANSFCCNSTLHCFATKYLKKC